MAEEKTGQPEKEIIYVPIPQTEHEDKIDILELWHVIWKGKWLIIGFTLLCTLASVYVTLYVLPVTYKSDTVLQPSESNDSRVSQLSSLAGGLPIPLNLSGVVDRSTSIINFLNSRALKIRLIENYNLLPQFYKDAWDDKKKSWKNDDIDKIPTTTTALETGILESSYTVNQDRKSSLITITWVDKEPEYAFRMLTAIIQELKYYFENEYESAAKEKRIFIEEQLQKAEKELDYWENRIPSKKVILSKILRERATAQSVFTELRTQLELAKISEVKEIVRFKVLDKPFIPEKKYGPQRSLICKLVFFLSGFSSLMLLLIWNFISNYLIRKK